MENMEILYKINNDFINNNKKQIDLDDIICDINNIINNNNINEKFDNIINIYYKMNNIVNEIKLRYKISEYQYKDIKILDNNFINNNKNNCKIIHRGKIYDLQEHFDIKNIKNTDKENVFLEIKLRGLLKIFDMSYMFNECSSLSSILYFSNFNTSNITNMKYMFKGCSSLKILPDISSGILKMLPI